MKEGIQIGSKVRIKRGRVGEGFRFTVTKIAPGHFPGEIQISGDNYGPILASGIEIIQGAKS